MSILGFPDVQIWLLCLPNCFKMSVLTVALGLICFVVVSTSVRVYLDEVQCARACQMLQDGYTQRRVAALMGVSQSNIRRVWQRYQETDRYCRRPASGRPRVTTPVE